MKNIGFVEDQNDIETVKFLVDSAKGIRTIKITKEENPMTEETVIAEETLVVADATKVENVEVAPEAPAQDAVADAPAVADEVAAEAPTRWHISVRCSSGASTKNSLPEIWE